MKIVLLYPCRIEIWKNLIKQTWFIKTCFFLFWNALFSLMITLLRDLGEHRRFFCHKTIIIYKNVFHVRWLEKLFDL